MVVVTATPRAAVGRCVVRASRAFEDEPEYGFAKSASTA
jgi:hypothetical protein